MSSYKHNEEKHLNIEHDLYDDLIYNKLILTNGLLSDAEKEIESEIGTGSALVQDIFNSFYKHSVNLKDPQTVDSIHQINRSILIQLAALPQWMQIRTQTRGDKVNASSATASTIENLIQNNQDLLTQIRNHLRNLQSVQKDILDLKKDSKDLADFFTQNKQKLTPKQIQDIKKKLQLYKKNLKTKVKARTTHNRNIQTVAKSINIASSLNHVQNFLDLQDGLFGWGDAAGFLRPRDAKESLEVQKILIQKPNIIKIARLAGRFHQLALTKKRQRVYHVYEEISDIKQSDEINRMIPSESMVLAVPELEPLFYKKLAEKALLTYELSGFEDKGEGPIVVCIDVSGSMGGDRDTWAKAVAIALIRLAQADKRDAKVIMFDWEVQANFTFLADEFSLKTLVQMASFFTGGGTSFDDPLFQAQVFIESNKKFEKGDIIFISDGDGQLSDEVKKNFLKFKVETRANMYTIIIGQMYEIITHSLKPLSDIFIPVQKLTEELAGELFEVM